MISSISSVFLYFNFSYLEFILGPPLTSRFYLNSLYLCRTVE